MNYQDVLAKLGAGSAHPGGLGSTLTWLNYLDLSAKSRVLEVGCGTGRSLLKIQETFNCQVVGVDIRPEMIEKAKIRSMKREQTAEWFVSRAERLPFTDGSFDCCITESVNVFVDVEKALSEYKRVLAPDGLYVDVEMVLMAPVDHQFLVSAQNIYGLRQVPTLKLWKKLYGSVGFETVRVLRMGSVNLMDASVTDASQADTIDVSSPGAMEDKRILKVLQQNADWMQSYSNRLGYAIFLCKV